MDGNRQPSRLAQLTAMDDGWALSSEFISAVLVWTLFGWLADRWLGTDPWLVAFGAVLGFVLGMYLVWLRAFRVDED
jgi:F0F1-type ATP synthase assembly protein I